MKDFAALPHSYKRAMEQLSDSEFGRLMRALIDYSADGTPIALTGNERFYAGLVMMTEDAFKIANEVTVEQRREAGRKGAESRWNGKNSAAISATEKRKEPKENTHNDSIYINNINTTSTTVKHYKQYGEYGWVKLTDEQYQKLLNDLGESLLTDTITKLDEYCQSNNNKNKYKDFNLVIRKAVREHWFERTASEKKGYSKPLDERDVNDGEFVSGFYADVMNRKRPGEGA